MNHYLEFKDGNSNKFWSIQFSGNSFTVIYGKIGTSGKAETKSFASEADANKEGEKLLKSKIKKGYVEADFPASFGQKAIAKATVKETKKKEPVKTEIVAPEDVKDDGTVHPWQSEEGDFWGDGFDEETFEILKEPETKKPAVKGPQKDIVEKYDETEYRRHLNKMEESGRFARLDEFLKELEIVKRYAVLVDEIEPEPSPYYLPPKDLYKYYLTATLQWIIDSMSFKREHIKIIEVLLQNGADFEKAVEEKIGRRIKNNRADRVHPMWYHFVEKYEEDPDYTKTELYFDEALTGLFKKSTDIAINLLKNLIEEIKRGKHPKFKGQNRLSNNIRGLDIYIHDYDKVIIYGIKSDGHTTLAEEEMKGINDMDESLVPYYALEYFKSQFEKIDKAELDSISSGIMEVRVEGVKDPIYKSKTETEETKAYDKEILEKAQLLEKTEDWKTDSSLIDEVVNHLVYQLADSQRALNIIKRFLYSGNTDAESLARKALERYDDNERRTPWWFERAVYWWNNFDYDWSLPTIQGYAKSKYPPAVDFYNNLLAEGILPDNKEKSDKKEDDKDYYREEFGYGNEANVQEFLDKFTEEDKFKETENVIMRAYSNARVYVRFKKESEKAYEEVLDFLLHLIEKGYVRIFDGYELCVRFVSKPEFIPKVGLPDTQTNAFFARAVRYKNLHEKIRQYVLQGMNMFDRYHDLNADERCTVVGAYAASALALIDKKHLDLAVRYGKMSDGEHEEVQLELAFALEKVYGVDKDTAPAIYELIISYDHEENKVKDTFYKDPDVLKAFTEYILQDNSHHKEHKVVRFMGCMIPKGGLKSKMKTLKAYYDNAADSQIKNIYADFYNLIIDYDAASRHSELNLEHLEYAGVELSKEEELHVEKLTVEKLTLKEELPVIIPAKDAEKRWGEKLNEIEVSKEDGRYFFIFHPIAITDPRFVIHIMEEFRKACQRDTYSKTGSGGFGGNCCYEFDSKWFADLNQTAYKYGICLYNGKNKPVVLYGALRYIDIVLKNGKRAIKDEEVGMLMQEYAVPGIKTPEGVQLTFPETAASKLLDEVVSALYREKYNAGLINIAKIKPEDGEYYKSAQVYKAFIMEEKLKKSKELQLSFEKDKVALKELYAELLMILPQYEDYWKSKLEE